MGKLLGGVHTPSRDTSPRSLLHSSHAVFSMFDLANSGQCSIHALDEFVTKSDASNATVWPAEKHKDAVKLLSRESLVSAQEFMDAFEPNLPEDKEEFEVVVEHFMEVSCRRRTRSDSRSE